MTPLETLKAARELITPKKAWTTGCYARSKSGHPVDANESRAVCWCAAGAIKKVTGKDELGPAFKKLRSLPLIRKSCGVFTFNDTHTHAELLAAFDAAIAKLEGK